MKITLLDNYPKQNGVYILSEIKSEFESEYLKVRNKENRVYSDEELKQLPFASTNNPHTNEWKVRAKSFLRFKNYFSLKNDGQIILDLGCGNGWFSGQLSKTFNHEFYCFDVNLIELKQGRKTFNSTKINFVYADIFSFNNSDVLFDLITINAAIQYFPDVNKLINKLLTLLKVKGEIHIIDSPIYDDSKVEEARKRTEEYYFSLGFPRMSKNYFHHSYEAFSGINFDVLYDPQSTFNKIRKLFSIKDSPFPWIRIRK